MAADALCLVGPGRIPFIGEDRNPAFALSVFAFGAVDDALLDVMDSLGAVITPGEQYATTEQATF